jgi:SAM-dependent methyltransferase
MEGYDDSSYGEAFADVYDEWYHGISDLDSTVSLLGSLAAEAPSLPVVELGVGTGRLAIPLAQALPPRTVWGIDSSAAMLDAMRAKPGSETVGIVHADMIEGLAAVEGALGVVFVAYNTFFNLGSRERQERCFSAVAERLDRHGSFVIEAFVPDEERTRSRDHIEVRSLTADRVVLSVTRYDGDQQLAEGQFIEITEHGGVRLRPWSIRYASPAELDAMATAAGLLVKHRWESFELEPFTNDSPRHVSVYSRA